MSDLIQNAISNISSPPILFFMLGLGASVLRSDLSIPETIGKALSIFFIMAIGFKGGVELSKNGFTIEVVIASGLTILLGFLTPIIVFYLLKTFFKIDVVNAGALAAHYGSVSVVTFVTGAAFLIREGIAQSGFMVAMMALMETPAIFVAILLVGLVNRSSISARTNYAELIKDALFNGSVVLLFGSMLIGLLTGEVGYKAMESFFVTPFQGILAIFLLEMGLVAGKRISEFKLVGKKLVFFGILMPIINASVAIILATMLGFSSGDTLLFAILNGSASYIAAPAAVRMALPEANPSYYITLSLAITFPFNVTLGIPLYYSIIQIVRQVML